ncbi:MAG TPA: methyltransferase domain-containing protein [Candidatus Cloacimonadota bacterium]|nr:methyltransferase domain-containing protein [Candidatus Cloacimonadota bacterium]HQH50315.1 methyltransferase domain-containing protein [Candidatus Cloacimonadota bacterium]
MAIPIINDWEKYFTDHHEGLGSSYERVVINNLLKRTVDQYEVKSVFESPSFGFTGISGINLLSLADYGISVFLEDHDEHRLDLIGKLWSELGRPLQTVYNRDYQKLDYPDSSFDMYFSFSALWFVQDLPCFLREVSRVTGKVIFISVPNITGLGYKMQIKDYSPQKYPDLRLGNIDRKSIIFILDKLGWKLREAGWFDCPPWPDIGMAKEDLLAKWLPAALGSLIRKRGSAAHRAPLSILDHYAGKDPDFSARMMKHNWLEKFAPRVWKKYWAHHYHIVFDRGRE